MIISEIGQNFLGSMDLARTLIQLSKKGGADLAKFQLYDQDKLYKDDTPNVELSFKNAKMLFDYGKEIGMEVFFSVFNVEKVKWCEEIGVKRYKIASRMRDIDVLREVEHTSKPTIISVDPNLSSARNFDGIQLFCLSEYPASVSLKYIDFPYGWQGFSDHTIGLDCAKIALARGAEIIEKHFCINHSTGVDAEWSMDYDELVELKRWETLCESVL